MEAAPVRTDPESTSAVQSSTLISRTADKMKTVKAACDKANAGPKKDAALKHDEAAEKAGAAKNGSECNRELEAAEHALT